MIKKFKLFILFSFFLFAPIKVLGDSFELYSNNVLVYNLNDNKILYAKNDEEFVSIASLTKIMSVLVSLEKIENLDEVVSFPKVGSLSGYSKLGYKYNEKITYRDLLYSAILSSAADSTEALAILTSGSVDNFLVLMNEKAKELEMSNTHFDSTYGEDSKNNYSTSRDLLKMMLYAFKNPEFYKIFTTMNYTLTTGKNISNSISYYNRKSNLDVTPIIGDKTGFTDIAGYCMISIYKNKDTNLLIITTNANPKIGKPTHVIDGLSIGNYYYDNYEYVNVLNTGDIIGYVRIFGIEEKIYSDENIKLYLSKDTTPKKEYKQLKRISIKSNVGDKIGEYVIKYNEEESIKDVTIPDTFKIRILLFLFKFLKLLSGL